MFNRQLRLAGSVVCLIAFFFRNMNLICLGLVLTAVGTINGVFFLEEEVKKLKEALDAKTKTTEDN